MHGHFLWHIVADFNLMLKNSLIPFQLCVIRDRDMESTMETVDTHWQKPVNLMLEGHLSYDIWPENGLRQLSHNYISDVLTSTFPSRRSGSFMVQQNNGILPAWRSGAGLDYIREASTVLHRLMILYGRSEPTQGRQNRSRHFFFFLVKWLFLVLHQALKLAGKGLNHLWLCAG